MCFFFKLHLHTGEVSEIYEHIEPKFLPKDYGGELESAAILYGNKFTEKSLIYNAKSKYENKHFIICYLLYVIVLLLSL